LAGCETGLFQTITDSFNPDFGSFQTALGVGASGSAIGVGDRNIVVATPLPSRLDEPEIDIVDIEESGEVEFSICGFDLTRTHLVNATIKPSMCWRLKKRFREIHQPKRFGFPRCVDVKSNRKKVGPRLPVSSWITFASTHSRPKKMRHYRCGEDEYTAAPVFSEFPARMSG